MWKTFIFASLLSVTASAHTAVEFGASRIVFDDASREQSFLLANQNAYPVVIQTWVDDGALSSNARFKDAPVITYPSLYKIPPGARSTLRLINSGIGNNRQDSEKLYWLNIQVVSPKTGKQIDDNHPELNVSLLLKFKLFYRPHKLKGPSSVALDAMKFVRVSGNNKAVEITNPTPYYVTFSRLSTEKNIVAGDFMLKPESQQTITLTQALPMSAMLLNYAIIDDSGLIKSGEVPIH